MSTTSRAALVALALGWAAAAHGAEVPIRNAGGYVLSAAPTTIGNATSRIDLIVHNDAESPDAAFCGYNSATLSRTPGPTSGDKLNPGEGKHICVFADRPMSCIGNSSTLYFDESRMVTPTPTP